MRRPMIALLLGLFACSSGSDADTNATDDTDTDTDTDTQVELPFDVGPWTFDFIDAEIDLCGYGSLRGRNVTLQAGGSAFEVSFDAPAPGPVTFDCTIDEMTYACTAPGQLILEGTFSSRETGFGDFVDDSCGSRLPYSASKR
jgi:hypothetical protein